MKRFNKYRRHTLSKNFGANNIRFEIRLPCDDFRYKLPSPFNSLKKIKVSTVRGTNEKIQLEKIYGEWYVFTPIWTVNPHKIILTATT